MLGNKNIVLLEGGKPQNYTLKPEYSNRVSALSGATKQLLEKIGAWQHIENARVCPVKKMQVKGESYIMLNKNMKLNCIWVLFPYASCSRNF